MPQFADIVKLVKTAYLSMSNLIDKSALLAEIEKLVDKGKYHEEFDCAYRDGNNSALYALKEKIDTLEVKEVDLNKEMQAFALLYLEPLKISDSNIGISITMAQLYRCAKHFFELGLKAQKGEKV